MSSSRLLVVDDHPINLKLISATLKFAGYEIATASDAERALEIIESSVVDLILLDIGLPGMDGLTLIKKLKSEEKTSHIPIIVLTAFAMKGDEEKAFAAGCDGYITKPINTRLVAEQVAQHLHKKRIEPPNS